MADATLDALAAALGPDVVLQGGGPDESSSGVQAQLRAALRREASLARLRLRPPAAHEVRGVHRLPPRRLRGGLAGWRRRVLRAGAVVELVPPGAQPRAIDVAAAAAGARPPDRVLLGTGGVVLGLTDVAGLPAVLRAVPEGRSGELDRSWDGLHHLRRVPLVPRPLARGTTAGLAWAVETRVPGRRPRRLSPVLAERAAVFLAGLPRGDDPPAVVAEDLAVLGDLLGLGDVVADVSTWVADRLAGLPSVVRHGDFWLGNLLAEGDALTGVVDWDSWHPSGVPGTDLLHLVATERRIQRQQALGAVWLEEPWEAPAFASAPYWDVLGLHPDREQRRAIGIAWWCGQVAGDVTRTPALAADGAWRAANVDQVADALRRRR